MTPSVGIIIYQSRLKIHRPIWCWLGWGVDRLRMNPWCAARLASAAKADCVDGRNGTAEAVPLQNATARVKLCPFKT